MDRKIVYNGEIPLGDDFLLAQRFTLTALATALKAILGTSTIVDGLPCTPTGPASMQVLVAPGSIYSLVNLDGTPYGDLAADTTHQIVKQGIVLDSTALSCPAPVTTGNSINYLIQVAYQDQDTDSAVLPYFDADNPPVAFAGPANTGVSQNTTRKGACVISVKAGVSATTGTQTTPAPDAGFMGLWYVTVANGATSITSGNIHLYTGTGAATGSTAFWSSPFIAEKLNDKVSIATGDLRWGIASGWSLINHTTTGTNYTYVSGDAAGVRHRSNSGTVMADTLPGTSPGVLPANSVFVVANDDASAFITVAAGTGASLNGVATGFTYIGPGERKAFISDGSNYFTITSVPRAKLAANTTFYVSTTGNDAHDGLTSATAFQTIQAAVNFVANKIDLNGFIATIQLADGTYSAGATLGIPWTGGGIGNVVINGNGTTPANVIISVVSNCFNLSGVGVNLIAQNLTMTISGSGACISCNNGAAFYNGPGLVFGSATSGYHVIASTNAIVYLNNNYTITGGAIAHLNFQYSGTIDYSGVSEVVTLTGTPAFSAAFAVGQGNANLSLNPAQLTFSGSATGSYYSLSTNATINTQGASASYLPGNAGGTTGTGGQYV